MPPRRKAKKKLKAKTHKLGISRIKKELQKAITKTEAALNAGRKALKRSRKKGDPAAIAANEAELQNNRWVLRNLEASFDAAEETCVDQVLNSDPTYEG